MKTIILMFLIIISCYSQENPDPVPMYPINNFDPTYENIAKPDEVLVVYRDTTSSVSDTMSLYIKNYYMSKRNIPEVNSYGLTLPFEDIIDGHRIRLWLNGEVIKDFDWQDVMHQGKSYNC